MHGVGRFLALVASAAALVALVTSAASAQSLAVREAPQTQTSPPRVNNPAQPPYTQQWKQYFESVTKGFQRVDERLDALEGKTPAAVARSAVGLEEKLALLGRLETWLRWWWHWGLVWGFLWWIPWFIFSWQWWRRRFWVFLWPWPWWWWIPWFWFVGWILVWWWSPCWWFWWCWLWWWFPWIFWIPWWLVVLKHCLQWLHTRKP